MITIKLTTDQAKALHNLLTVTNIEPALAGQPLLNSFNPQTDHLLWPLLDTLRQQMQLEQLSIPHLRRKKLKVAFVAAA